MGKYSIARVPLAHFATLKNSKGCWSLGDFVIQLVIPVVCGVFAFVDGYYIQDSSLLIAGVSTAAALMGAIAVLVFQVRLTLEDDTRLDKYDYALVDELFANIVWGITVGFLLSLVLVLLVLLKGFEGAGGLIVFATSIAVALGIHFVVVVMMCIKRLARCYDRIAAKKA